MTAIAEETLAFRCGEFSSPLSLLMPTFAFLKAPARLPANLHRRENAPLPRFLFHCFGSGLDARLLSMPAPLDQ
jgi:hypothetical protein